jgi:hypothetical protein
MADGGRDTINLPRQPVIHEAQEEEEGEKQIAKEQKITPFDVVGGVDEQGRPLAM